MKTIDYIYRFDPKNPSAKPIPPDAEAARRNLEAGNRMFSQWMASCQTSTLSADEPQYIVPCNGLEVGMVRVMGQLPKQAPFAVVVGCSDARVPTEMIFGQGFNDLFVIRVAGNVLGDVCLGSIDFALSALSDSVKVVVMLGHSGCGAVTGAVDAYLRPLKFWSKTTPPPLRAILQKIFVAVRESANGISEVWGPDAAENARLSRSTDRNRRGHQRRAIGVRSAARGRDGGQVGNRSLVRGLQHLQPPGESGGTSQHALFQRKRSPGSRSFESARVQGVGPADGRDSQADGRPKPDDRRRRTPAPVAPRPNGAPARRATARRIDALRRNRAPARLRRPCREAE